MDIQLLKIFYAVAKSGSFSAAANELNYAQSHISTKMQALEGELNTVLFYRHNRGVTLTHKGEELLSYAKEILRMLDKAEKAMKDEGLAVGSLAIGSLETIAQAHLPRLLTAYHSQNPHVKLTLTTGDSEWLKACVLDRTLDAAFVSGAVTHPELAAELYKKEHMLLASCMTEQTVASWKDIRDKTLLVFSRGCYYRALLEQLLRENSLVPADIIEFNSVGAVIASLCAGLGISLLPASVLEQYTHSNLLTTYEVPKRYAEVATYLIYRKDCYVNTAFSNFLRCLSI